MLWFYKINWLQYVTGDNCTREHIHNFNPFNVIHFVRIKMINLKKKHNCLDLSEQ